jgi:hypothetical protein
MELDIKVKNKASEAVVISHASIVIPFALLVCLILCLTDLRGVQFLSFSLFMGCHEHNCLSVLARIVQEGNS